MIDFPSGQVAAFCHIGRTIYFGSKDGSFVVSQSLPSVLEQIKRGQCRVCVRKIGDSLDDVGSRTAFWGNKAIAMPSQTFQRSPLVSGSPQTMQNSTSSQSQIVSPAKHAARRRANIGRSLTVKRQCFAGQRRDKLPVFHWSRRGNVSVNGRAPNLRHMECFSLRPEHHLNRLPSGEHATADDHSLPPDLYHAISEFTLLRHYDIDYCPRSHDIRGATAKSFVALALVLRDRDRGSRQRSNAIAI